MNLTKPNPYESPETECSPPAPPPAAFSPHRVAIGIAVFFAFAGVIAILDLIAFWLITSK